MALVLADRVLETCNSPGTGAATLLGATTGYQTFLSGIGNGNTCYYCIADREGANWEVGIGTYASAGNTLTRTTPISGSSATPVNFSSGIQNVFVTYPAEKSVNKDDIGNVIIEAATNSGSALRITQTGTGNALLVEDSANPDSTPTVIGSSGEVVIGGTARFTTATTGSSALQMSGSESIARFINDANPLRLEFIKSRNTTWGSAGTIVQNGDQLGDINFQGADGVAFIKASSITSEVDGTPGTNDMPGRLVFSTTADGASSPTERMRIDNAGRVGIGGAAGAGNSIVSYKTMTGGSGYAYGFNNVAQVNSDTTAEAVSFQSYINTQASAFTLTSLRHFKAYQATIGAGSTVTNQFGFFADPALTGATNNYGFYSNIASGTGRYNFYAAGTAQNYFAGDTSIAGTASLQGNTILGPSTASAAKYPRLFAYDYSGSNLVTFLAYNIDSTSNQLFIGGGSSGTPDHYASTSVAFYTAANNTTEAGTERMRIDSAGNVGIGGTPSSGISLYNNKNITGATGAYGFLNQGQIQSDVTGAAYLNMSQIWTAAASFTLPVAYGYFAHQGTIGAGSAITSQYGYFANSSLTGATNNYGFYSNIASGTGRWNFYAAGTASNYFAGKVGVGTLPFNGTALTVTPAGFTDTTLYGIDVATTVPATATAAYYSYLSYPTTAAAAFTLPKFAHFEANAPAFGAGSTVTSQYGFSAQNGLTGATNNYGFYSNIASGTGLYNFYAAGSAQNYFAGAVTVAATVQTALTVSGGVNIGSSTATTNTKISNASNWNFSPLDIVRNATNAASSRSIAFMLDGDSASSTTIGAYNAIWGTYDSAPTTGSTSAALNGAMVYGAYAGHRWVTNGAERMRIDAVGNIGIGSGTAATSLVQISGTLPSSSALSFALSSTGTVPSTTTSQARYYSTYAGTAAASFTLSNLWHYYATQGTFGAGSTVTSQYGFAVESSLTGATNNYGFHSNIASGTGRWNFYAAGSADNYFAGKVGIARTNPSVELEVGDGNGTRRISIDGASSGAGGGAALYFKNGGTVYGGLGNPSALDGSAYSNLITLTSYYGLTFNTLATERMRITSAGGVSFGATGTAYGTTGQVLTSNGNAPPSWQSAAGGAQGFVTQYTGANSAPGGFMADQNFALI